MTMTITDLARMGGKARWKNVDPKTRSELMRKIRTRKNESQGVATEDSKQAV